MLAAVAVLILSQIVAAQAESRAPIKQPSFSPEAYSYVPHTARDISSVVLRNRGSQLAVFAWSLPSKNAPGFDSSVVVLRETGKQTKPIWHLRLSGAYSPSLIERADFEYRGEPLVLLRVQFGAAAARLYAIGVERGKVVQLGSIEANDFEYVDLAGSTYIKAHDYSDTLDVPLLYRWTGRTFVDDRQDHPEFYKELADQIRNKSDITKFAKPAQFGFARILGLSGEQSTVPDR